VTADQRFTLIMAGLGLVAAVIGWLLRSLWVSQKAATEDNTNALRALTAVVGVLAERMAHLEGRMTGRR
jgi:hypothetical protein